MSPSVWDMKDFVNEMNDKFCSTMDAKTAELTDAYEKRFGKKLDAAVDYAIKHHQEALAAPEETQFKLFTEAQTAFALVMLAACSGNGSSAKHVTRITRLMEYRLPVFTRAEAEDLMTLDPENRQHAFNAFLEVHDNEDVAA